MNEAAKMLVGKTIKSAKVVKHREDCDSENLLILEMIDGSIFEIEGGNGEYTGGSCEEYVEILTIRKQNRVSGE